jgi:pSer/pThr/pTyr-binding forkhead associated (FHA) protein
VLKLIIEDDEGRKTVVPFVREEITIGRQEGNTIRLTERNVSRRHARLLRQNGHVVVEDLGSSNGTRINGERISGQSAIKDGDLIQIGDYDLALQSEAAAAAAAKGVKAAPAPAADDDEPSDPDASGAEPETELETPVAEDSANSAADARRHSTAIISMDKVEANRTRKVKELEAEVAPRLVVVSAELKGQEFACIRTEMRIGRTDDNDIVIDHRSLSRTHAKIVREDNGEWRIMDMQSANGLTVNGESYAQASLNPGDVIELGHVKLRFVAAGDHAGAGASGGRSKLPLVAVFVLLLLLGGGAAAFLLIKPSDTPKPPEITTNDPPKQPEQPQQVQPPEPKQPTPTPPPPDQPVVEPGAQAAKDLQARLESAKRALAQGKLDKAEDDLSPLKKADGTWPDEVKLLVSEIEAEKQALQALTDAQKAIDSNQLAEAEQLLAKAEISSVFAEKREQVAAALADARKAAIKVEPPKPPQTAPPKPTPPLGPSPQDQAKTAYEDARRLLKAQQYGDALFMGNKCLELDPKNSECHMVLGATYASMENKMEQAAFHYREFLKLAPDHKLAPRIKQNLDEYEKRNPKKP